MKSRQLHIEIKKLKRIYFNDNTPLEECNKIGGDIEVLQYKYSQALVSEGRIKSLVKAPKGTYYETSIN